MGEKDYASGIKLGEKDYGSDKVGMNTLDIRVGEKNYASNMKTREKDAAGYRDKGIEISFQT